MSSSFSWLVEAGLKPLFKGVLNRVLSPYMLQKLELAQISCRLTDDGGARIGIRDLELDPDALGPVLDSLPVDIVTGTVGFLDAKIPFSVQGVLDDGATLDVSEVRLCLKLTDLVEAADGAESVRLQQAPGHLTGEHGEHGEAAAAAGAADGEPCRGGSLDRHSRRMNESVSSIHSDTVMDIFDEPLDAQSTPEGMSLVEAALKRVFANIEGSFTDVELDLDCGDGRHLIVRVDHLSIKDTTANLCAPDAEGDFDQATAAERTRQMRCCGLHVIARGFPGSAEGGVDGGEAAGTGDERCTHEFVLMRSTSAEDSLVSLITREHPQPGVAALSVDVSLQDVEVIMQPTDFGVVLEAVDRLTPRDDSGLPDELLEFSVQTTSLAAWLLLDNVSIGQRIHVCDGVERVDGLDYFRLLLDHPQMVYTGASVHSPTANVEVEVRDFTACEISWLDGGRFENSVARFDPLGPEPVAVPPRLAHRFSGLNCSDNDAPCALTASVLLRPSGDVRVKVHTGRLALAIDPLVVDRFEHYYGAMRGANGMSAHANVDGTGAVAPQTFAEMHIPTARLQLQVPQLGEGEMHLPDSGRGRSTMRHTQALGLWVDASRCVIRVGIAEPEYDEELTVSFSDAIVHLVDGDDVAPIATLSRRDDVPASPIIRCAIRAAADMLTRAPTPLPSPFGQRFSRFEGSDPAVHPANMKEASAFQEAGQAFSEYDLRIDTPALDSVMTSQQYSRLMRLVDDLVLCVSAPPAAGQDTHSIESDSDEEEEPAAAAAAARDFKSHMHDMALQLRAERARLTIDFGDSGDDGKENSNISLLDVRGQCLEVRTLVGQHGSADQTVIVHARSLCIDEKLGSDRVPVCLIDPAPYSTGGDYSDVNPRPHDHMLSVSVTMELNPAKTHSRMKVAVAATNLRLHHRMLEMGQNWIFRVLSWMKYPQLNRPVGYRFPEELMQLHIHFWDLAILYRPLQLMTTCEILCHHFMVTSNLSSDPNEPDESRDLVMAFFAENLALYIRCEEGADGIVSAPELHPRSRGMRKVLFDDRLDLQLRESQGRFEVSLEDNDCLTLCARADSLCTLSEAVDHYFSGHDLTVSTEDGGAPVAHTQRTSTSVDDNDDGDNDSFYSAMGDDADDRAADHYSFNLGGDEKKAEPLAETLSAMLLPNGHGVAGAAVCLIDDEVIDEEAASAPAADEVCMSELSTPPTSDQGQGGFATQATAHTAAEVTAQDEADVRAALAEAMGTIVNSPLNVEEGPVEGHIEDALEFDWNHFGDVELLDDPVGGAVYPPIHDIADAGPAEVAPSPALEHRGDATVVSIAIPVQVEANHFVPKVHDGRAAKSSESRFPEPVFSLRLKGMAAAIQLYRGYDWEVSSERSDAEQDRFDGDEKEAVILDVHGLSLEFDEYGPTDRYSMRVSVTIHQIEILDRLVRTTRINKLMTDFKTPSHPRDTSADMVALDWVTARNPEMKAGTDEEIILRLALLPLRLNLDQLAVIFLAQFYEYVDKYFLVEEDQERDQEAQADPIRPTFVKLCHIDPVFVQVDYEPRVSNYYNLIRKGDLSELVGIVPLRHAYVSLSGVTTRGTTGWDKLSKAVFDEWMTDCIRIHGPTVLSGVAGIRPLTRVAQATFDIVREPVVKYPHIIQGLAGGFESGARTTAVEFCNIFAAVAEGVRVALEVADSAVSSASPKQVEHYSNQPADAAQGLIGARDALYFAGREAFERVYVAPRVGRSHRFVRASIVAKTIGAAPGAALRPLIGLCEAVEISLQGVRNSLHPESREDSLEKYR
mmetsp:Transcript_10364/g.31195  ORF Transcript_10364/g.31195 Transcript_10364/m.31195 type:complete len:1780 (-) Transcript_10364:95-5434(-)